MSKRALGRGLEALIFNSSDDKGIKEIPLSEIQTNIDQPRKEFNLDSLEELAESIRTHGLLQPILVRLDGQNIQLLPGSVVFGLPEWPVWKRLLVWFRNVLLRKVQREPWLKISKGLIYHRLMKGWPI